MKYLTEDQINELKAIDTPTVANAVETHESRLNTEGFMGWNINCLLYTSQSTRDLSTSRMPSSA